MTDQLNVETPSFWFVWTKTGHVPRRKHGSEAGALAEAERLARANPGKKFIVLRATHKLSISSPETATGCEASARPVALSEAA